MGTLEFLGLVLGEDVNLPGLCEDVKSMKRNRLIDPSTLVFGIFF